MTKRFYGRGTKAKFELISLVDDMVDQEVADPLEGSKLADSAPAGKLVASISRNTLPPRNSAFEQKSQLTIQNTIPQADQINYAPAAYSEQQAQELLDFLDLLDL